MTEGENGEENSRSSLPTLIGIPFVLLFGEGIGLAYGWKAGFCAGFFMGAITYPVVCSVHLWVWLRR